ncbi:hypothetical protein STRIP9103_04603 [Streptomyces ipomoeae 91-03]|uniref:Uncharacterized protein n=1 Tax=Streptomyces ipomoeae 91-03 TaxID=698759 RepID=L1L0H6_9ACTN|nr:hypothetical protein STRIP9103_04603 [Streptomyces ipomoeae 91-03]
MPPGASSFRTTCVSARIRTVPTGRRGLSAWCAGCRSEGDLSIRRRR